MTGKKEKLQKRLKLQYKKMATYDRAIEKIEALRSKHPDPVEDHILKGLIRQTKVQKGAVGVSVMIITTQLKDLHE